MGLAVAGGLAVRLPPTKQLRPTAHRLKLMGHEWDQRQGWTAGLLVLVVRGVLSWLVVPIALVAWPVVHLRQHTTGVTLGQYLGWIDLNLIACVQRVATPLLVRKPIPWTPSADISKVTHRLRATDPA